MLLYTTLIALSIALGSAAFLTTRQNPRVGTIGAGIGLILLCVKALFHWQPVWEAAVLPWTGYAWIQQFAIYPIVTLFFGFAAAKLPITWNRVVVILTGFGFLSFGAVENSWIAWPQTHGRADYADADHHLKQSTHYTCGPAACVCACAHVGVRITERDMAELCLTHDQGSRLFNLYRGLTLALAEEALSLSIEEASLDDLMRPGSIAVTSNRGGGHALCLVGQGNTVLVHDPLYEAPKTWSREVLAKNQTGPVVSIERPLPGSVSPASKVSPGPHSQK